MRIQPFTEDDLEAIAKQYEEEVAAGVKHVMKHFTSSITAASFQTISLDDLSTLATRWAKFAIEDLLPSLISILTHGAERLTNEMPPVPGHVGIGSPDAIYRNTLAEEFLTRAENRLVGVGNDLWEHARIEVAEAFKQGESIDEIALRLRNAANLTEPRARTVARTEAIAASNAGTLLEMRSYELTATKEWVATNDSQTRPTHAVAEEQIVDIDDSFIVGTALLDYPGDPTGPPGEVINCRCTMVYEINDDEVDSLIAAASSEEFAMPDKLQDYWTHGEGAAKIRWGTPGDFTRCVRQLREHVGPVAEGTCANLHHKVLGKWPGEDR